jgi:predicted component of type VI protein secretion system
VLPLEDRRMLDAAPAVSAFSISADGPVVEGDGPGTATLSFTVSRTDASQPATVDFHTEDGTAQAGADYQAVSRTITFGPGEAAQQITVEVRGDRLVEGQETVAGRLGNPVGGTLAKDTALGTILDDDTATLAFADSTSNAREADGTHMVAVTLQAAENVTLASDVSVRVAVDAGSSTATGAGVDYAWGDPVWVTFPAGSGNGTVQEVAITVVDDTAVEGEEVIGLRLSDLTDPTGQVSLAAGADRQQVWLADNDTAVVAFSAAQSTTSEGTPRHEVTVSLTITANGVTGQGELAAPVSVELTDRAGGGTAEGRGVDCDFTDPTTITFATGATSTGQAVPVTIVDDPLVEGEETFSLQLQHLVDPTGQVSLAAGADRHEVRLVDNDTAVIAFSAAESVAAEGTPLHAVTVSLTITANGVPGQGELAAPVSIDVTDLVDEGTAQEQGVDVDYRFTDPTTLTFAAGTTSSERPVTLAIVDDRLVEGDETVVLGLQRLSDTTGQVSLAAGADRHQVRLVDNDTAVVAFSTAQSSVDESTPSHTVSVTLTITANGVLGAGSLGTPVTVEVVDLVAAGTALAAAEGAPPDYTLPSPPLVAFPAGSVTGAQQSLTTHLNDDPLVEPAETVVLQLGQVAGAGGQVSVLNAARVHVVTIYSDDTVPPSIDLGEPVPVASFIIMPAEHPVLLPLGTTTSPPTEPLETAEAGPGVVAEAEDHVVLYLVTPTGDGQLEEQEVTRWPVDQLGRLPELLKYLPDDRYRFYHLCPDGARRLILDVMLREGQPIDPAEATSGATSPEPHTPPAGPSPAGLPGSDGAAQPNSESSEERLPAPAQPVASGMEGAAQGTSLRIRRAVAAGLDAVAFRSAGPWRDRVQHVLASYSGGPLMRATWSR